MNRRIGVMAIVFALVALFEIGELVIQVRTLTSPDLLAAQHGISVRAEQIRAVIILVFALVLALNALLALAGLLTRMSIFFAMGALSGGVLAIIDGVYQTVSAIVQYATPVPAALIGLVYIAVGALMFWFGRAKLPARA